MKLSIINEEFDYSDLANDKWGELLKEMMDISNISFDLENDYDVSDDRLITVHIKDEDSENPLKDQVRCQMFEAGGDWQEPTCYFRCKVTEGYFYCSCTNKLRSQHTNSMFCLIPPKDDGNHHLIGVDGGKFVPSDADCTKDRDEKVVYNKKDCWAWLKDMLEKMCNEADEKNANTY